MKKTVALVGMMGAGKTAVGKALAARLGVPFLDSDGEIEKAAAMSIAEIFERYGEPFFRRRETEVIARLLEDERAILSTGGGAFLSEANRALISERGVSVWLKADLDLLWNRVKHKSTRPLLRSDDPRATLAAFVEAREPLYAQAAIVVEAEPRLSVEAMAEKVIGALRAHGGILVEEEET
ncbi:shikimate kinase [Celeribacter indicus]|uniref:Shikimate kinase n=1 Tax=Celeribacter indicus TaxID=1208324 RepID=A0A0B5DWC1_9RHOB|nr:shikimate kinase [Celeribacter indicus]